jgi:16S rRNA (guanine966-N2)-methyltransferase
VREAVFNALGSLDIIEGGRVVDLFAGTGALGIEALSRGATHCVFVERDRTALAVLRENIKTLGLSDQSTVISGDATSPTHVGIECDVLLADPPYGFSAWQDLLRHVKAAIVVVESDDPIGAIAGWEAFRERRYGRTNVTFLRPLTTGT